MNLRKNIMMIVSVMVAVIIALSVLVPVIQDSSASEDTFTNTSYYGLSAIDGDTDVTIVWKVATPNTITINGEDMDLSDLPIERSYTLIGSSSAMVRYTFLYNMTFIEILGNPYINLNTGSTSFTEATFTISGTTLSATNDAATPLSQTYTLTGDAYYIVPDGGEYTEVMKDANTPVYVKGDSDIHLIGSTLLAPIIGIYGEGSIDDGITLSTVYKANAVTTDVTYSDVTATTTEVSGYKNLYLLEKFEFTISYNTDQSVDSTYTYFVVPYEVTAERSAHVTPIEASLLGIIPLLVVIGIVIGAVWFIRQKN